MRRRLALSLFVAALLLSPLSAPAFAGGGGGCRSLPVTESRNPAVVLEAACFTPTIVRIDPGETVTFLNRDSFRHVITGAHSQWGSYEELQPEGSVGYTFNDPGLYAYSCYLHPGMTGVVVVGDADSAVGESVDVTEAVAASQVQDEAEKGTGNDALAAPKTGDGVIDRTAGMAAALALAALAFGFLMGRRRGRRISSR